MPRILLTLAVIGIAVYALSDLARTDRDQTGGLPKWLWAVLIVMVPAIGAVAWIVFRRSVRVAGDMQRPAAPGPGRGVPGSGPGLRQPGTGRPTARRRGPSGPDDDPEFLRRLEDDLRRGEGRKGEGRKEDTDDTPA